MSKCFDPRCATCFPESYDPPPDTETSWPWLAIILIALAVFVVFTILFMTQGGAFRPELGG